MPAIALEQHAATRTVVIEVGGLPIAVHTSHDDFERILRARYGDFLQTSRTPRFQFHVEIAPPAAIDPDADAEVLLNNGEWTITRGDFRASWRPSDGRGNITQTANPYAIDSVLRIVHTLLLAPEGGFLLHASSAVRNGRAFLFSGVSEAGKTTMARLAPPDVTLLTDEASYIRKVNGQYLAYGTPFAGELGEPGKNISAPVAALYLLKQGPVNRIDPIPPADALRRLLRNILFFAHEPQLVRQVFDAAAAFVAAVPVFELTFLPDQRVWELIA